MGTICYSEETVQFKVFTNRLHGGAKKKEHMMRQVFEKPDFSKSGPYVYHFRGGLFEFDVPVADDATWNMLNVNRRVVEAPELKKLVEAGQPLTGDQLVTVINGKPRTATASTNTPDPGCGPISCIDCRKSFQPIIYDKPVKDKKTDEITGAEKRGSFLEQNVNKLQELTQAVKDYVLEHSRQIFAVMLPGERISSVVVIGKCPRCIKDERDDRNGDRKVIATYRPADEIVKQVRAREGRVVAAKERIQTRNDIMTALTGRRRQEGGDHHSSYGGHSRGSRTPVEQSEDFHGASLQKSSATALCQLEAKGQLTNGLYSVVEKDDQWLVVNGVAHSDEAAQAVKRRCQRRIEQTKGAVPSPPVESSSSVTLGDNPNISNALRKFQQGKAKAAEEERPVRRRTGGKPKARERGGAKNLTKVIGGEEE